ncbi:MAG: cofactor-independent phosphoglycerate mutase [Phycisphaerae bacterium]|nr:cofactor-independent phosphoglycerate mutase [Phycisphaerae bacterium]
MKYALILPDGAADEPLEELDGRTPLAAAHKPNIDWISIHGRQGTVVTVPKGYLPGSDVATLSVVGCDPKRFYTGRAPIEAAARRLAVGPKDVVYRCNLVTIVDEKMEDFTAGHIRAKEAERIIADLNSKLGNERISFHVGVGYRHLMILKDAVGTKVEATPPHDIPGQPIARHLPRGRDADLIRVLMERSQDILAHHDVNEVRRELGENPATSIWLWGQGPMPKLERFRDRFGITGAAIGAVDLFRGVAVCLGWTLIDVEGATGFIDTNYAGKGQAIVDALDDYDLVAVHIEAPDEAGHMGDHVEKTKAIEQIDEHIVGPVLKKLRTFDEWRVLIAPDHPTPCSHKTHTAEPPPFCMAGTGVKGVLEEPFTEANAVRSDLHVDPGHELMEYFLRFGRNA